jgi:hypothetical protein
MSGGSFFKGWERAKRGGETVPGDEAVETGLSPAPTVEAIYRQCSTWNTEVAVLVVRTRGPVNQVSFAHRSVRGRIGHPSEITPS